MSTLLEKIKKRGYWQTVIRPVELKPNRLKITGRMVEQLRTASVQLRGWDFPHVDFNTGPLLELDSVGQDTEWQYFHELWRVFESGQFLHVAGMRHDWGAPVQLAVMERVPDGAKLLGMGDTIFRFTEIALFSQSYVRGILGGAAANVECEVGGLKGRYLVVDDPGRIVMREERTATTSNPYPAKFSVDGSTSREELLGVARAAAARLFTLFNAEINSHILEDWQSKIGRF